MYEQNMMQADTFKEVSILPLRGVKYTKRDFFLQYHWNSCPL